MTALFGDDPIIITGTTNNRRYTQFWQGNQCRISMDDRNAGTLSFHISHGCPNEWLDEAWDTYRKFLDGIMPAPTHTVRWQFGKPEFTPTGRTE